MKCTEKAYAKVNLSLLVGEKRPDGYHQVETVMQTVSLYDTVTVETGGDGSRLVCHPPVTEQPEDNLCMRAAAAFAAAVGEAAQPVTITLTKRIPTQAGLGGGSSDGAAVLRAMRTLFAPRLSDGELETIAATLGSDVPFFIRGGTMLAQGRGERLTPLAPWRDGWLVIVKPEESFSTAEMYRRLDAAGVLDMEKQPLPVVQESPGTEMIAAALRNSFERVVPETSAVWEIQALLREWGAMGTLLSGSGSAVFGIFDREFDAQRAAEALGQRWPRTFAVQPV